MGTPTFWTTRTTTSEYMNIVQILTNLHYESGLSPVERARVQCAAELLREDPDSGVLISGTEIPFSPTTVAHHQLVAEELLSNGIDESRIVGRLKAADSTVKEAAHAKDLLDKTHFETLTVVTSFAHFPRAPYVFAHFFTLDQLSFYLVPDCNSKDVVLLTALKEAEAYHVLRSQEGVFVPPGNHMVKTPFDYAEFADMLSQRVRLWGSTAPDYDIEAGTEELDLFKLYHPGSPFGRTR